MTPLPAGCEPFLCRGTRFARNARASRGCGLFLSLVAVSLTAASAFGQIGEDNQKTTIRGTVINALTQMPIARALVHTSDDRYATLTNGEGRFEFTLRKPDADAGSISGRIYFSIGSGFGAVYLTARKPGFLDDYRDRREVPAAPGSDITISLIPEGLIKGRVTTSTGEPLTDLNLQLFARQVEDGLQRWRRATSARVNSSGEFRFAGLSPGEYKVATNEAMDNDPVTSVPGAQQYGFPPVYFPNVTDFSGAQAIAVAAGQTVEADLSVTRQAYYEVRIPIANSDVTGGVNVSVEGQRGPGYSLGYNWARQRIEGLLPGGNYVVKASTYGMNSMTGMVNLRVTNTPAEGPPMMLVRNSSISLDIKEEFSDTRRSRSLSWTDGEHTYTSRGPRTYLEAHVEAADDDFTEMGRGWVRPPAGPNGDAMVIENVMPGRYWLRLSSSRGYVASATMGGVDLLHEPLVVGSGSNTTVEVEMRDDGGEIDGTVQTLTAPAGSSDATVQQGPPAPGAWVCFVPMAGGPGQFQMQGVNGDGKFQSPSMAPGDYMVLAFTNRQPNLPYRDSEAMRAYDSKGQVVHLAAGQKVSVQLQAIADGE